MLVLTRKSRERIQIGDHVTITVLRVQGRSVRLGIEAPQRVKVLRGELADAEREQADRLQPARSASLDLKLLGQDEGPAAERGEGEAPSGLDVIARNTWLACCP